MPRAWQFHLSTTIHFGSGLLRKLGSLARPLGERVLLVTYAELGPLQAVVDRAHQTLENAGVLLGEFAEVAGEPDVDVVQRAAAASREFDAQCILALGGGSVLDVAKGAALLARTEGSLWDHTDANPQSSPARDALPLVAVPTTAGTGSEVSSVAVFSYPPSSYPAAEVKSRSPLKAAIYGPALQPALAVVDPSLTVGMPSGLTAACGADALGHAIEACVSRWANPMSTMLAREAVALIVRDLAVAAESPDAPKPRDSLALAATLAGAAFSHSGVTMAHAVAQALGSVLDLSHGQAVALATPSGLRFNATACTSEYACLARQCGLVGPDEQQLAEQFVEKIVALLDRVGLPHRVTVPADHVEPLVARLATSAEQYGGTPLRLNPRKVDREALETVFREVLGH